MEAQTLVHHVTVECSDVKTADTFFIVVLGIPKVKSTLLSRELCLPIFNVDTPVQMETYDNGKMRVEAFITPRPVHPSYVHIGIAVDSKEQFLLRCQQHGLAPFFVEKNGRQLLFVRDYSGNLYEIIS